MALDPDKYKSLRSRLEMAIDYAPIEDSTKQTIEDYLFEQMVGELDTLIDDSRPPRVYIFGRAGSGKSSLINALAGKEVADVGAIEPTTIESERIHVPFPERYANWDIIDSRGLFESIPADKKIPGGTIDAIKEDFEEYEPDIAVHIMTPDQVRSGRDDFEAVAQLNNKIGSGLPPLVYCLNKVDTHLTPDGEWPPDMNDSLSNKIIDNLNFVTDVLDQPEHSPFDPSSPVRGYNFYSPEEIEDMNPSVDDSLSHIGVYPTYLKQEPYWNIETLSELLGNSLPEEAVLQFAQAQRNYPVLKRLSRKQTTKFAGRAATIAGADLSGVSDIVLLTPLQVYLVMLIGSFSCREFSTETAREYFSELGVVGGAGFGLRKVASALAGVIPGPGQAVNAMIAGAGTYAIGRSAEKYYFGGEFVAPEEFIADGKEIISDQV